MKKIISVLTAALLGLSLCGCGDDSSENETIYSNFKSYISENGTEDNYYIQISKTADSANTLIEASRIADDCAFMEYDVSGTLKFFRGGKLTEISPQTYYAAEETDADWNNFEYEKLSEKYRNALTQILESDAERTVEKTKTDNKEMPYRVTVRYNTGQLDAKSIFSNGGNFGIVSIKFETDAEFKKFSEVTVSCQYDYNSVIYLYSATFGDPNLPDSNGENGQTPDAIEKVFDSYKEKIAAQMEAFMNEQS